MTAAVRALEPAGHEAAFLADVFWWVALGAGAIWIVAMAFLIYCLHDARARRAAHGPSKVVPGDA